MAVKGSGLGAGPDPAMVDQTHFDARNGAPKKPQTSFPVKEGMKDQNAPSGVTNSVGPAHPGVGPDASAKDVLDPYSAADRGKLLKKQPGGVGAQTSNGTWVPGKLSASWGMKGGDGQGVDPDMSGKVLGDAIVSGSTKLPASVNAASGPAPAYTGRDPN